MHKVTRYEFINLKAGRHVAYFSVINGGAFSSIHRCQGMNDIYAKRAFHMEHQKECEALLLQNKVHSLNNKFALS